MRDSPARVLRLVGIGSGVVYLVVLFSAHAMALRSASFVLLVLCAIALWVPSPSRRIPLLGVFAFWLTAAVLSLLTTTDLHASLLAMENDIARSFIVFFAFYSLTRTSSEGIYRIWVFATAAGMLIVSLIGMVSVRMFGDWRNTYTPSLGDFGTSAVTAFSVLMGYVAFADDRRWAKAFILAAIGAMLTAGYLTASRAFWLSIIAGAVVLILLRGIRAGSLGRRTAVAIVMVVAMGILAATLVSIGRGKALLYSEDRAPLYALVAEKVLTNPFTGTGYGHETDKVWFEEHFPGKSFLHAHNVVLSYLDQMGPLGLVALGFIFAIPAVRLARGVRAPMADASVAAMSGLALLVCVLVKNNLDYFFLKQNLWLYYAYLGISLGELDRVSEAGRSAS